MKTYKTYRPHAKGSKTINLGDLNARVGNAPINNVKQKLNEETSNENGGRLMHIRLLQSNKDAKNFQHPA